MQLRYETRDGQGSDIVKEIEIKEFKVTDFGEEKTCAVCGETIKKGVLVKDAVSGNFTDWNYFDKTGAQVCAECSALFSLYPYSYIYAKGKGIKLFNIRQTRDAIKNYREECECADGCLICITTSRKKHLFYKTQYHKPPITDAGTIYIQLENETVKTSVSEQMHLFDFAEALITLGTPKSAQAQGILNYQTYEALSSAGIAEDVIKLLRTELYTNRAIQIPLYAAQKAEDLTEEEAVRYLKKYVR